MPSGSLTAGEKNQKIATVYLKSGQLLPFQLCADAPVSGIDARTTCVGHLTRGPSAEINNTSI